MFLLSNLTNDQHSVAAQFILVERRRDGGWGVLLVGAENGCMKDCRLRLQGLLQGSAWLVLGSETIQ